MEVLRTVKKWGAVLPRRNGVVGMFGISGSEVVVLVLDLTLLAVFVVGVVTVARWIAGRTGRR